MKGNEREKERKREKKPERKNVLDKKIQKSEKKLSFDMRILRGIKICRNSSGRFLFRRKESHSLYII